MNRGCGYAARPLGNERSTAGHCDTGKTHRQVIQSGRRHSPSTIRAIYAADNLQKNNEAKLHNARSTGQKDEQKYEMITVARTSIGRAMPIDQYLNKSDAN